LAHVLVEASGEVFAAACTAAEAIGDWVHIAGPAVAGLPYVERADPSQLDRMPAVGMVLSKASSTRCLVGTSGVVAQAGPPLTPGGRYFVGLDGRLLLGPPAAGPGPVFWQTVAVAVDEGHVELSVSLNMHRRLP
jgi:hypothetical protein